MTFCFSLEVTHDSFFFNLHGSSVTSRLKMVLVFALHAFPSQGIEALMKLLPTVAAGFEGDVRRQAQRRRAERVQAVQGVVPLVSTPSLLGRTSGLLSLAVPAVAETAVPDAAGFWTGRLVQGLQSGGGGCQPP